MICTKINICIPIGPTSIRVSLNHIAWVCHTSNITMMMMLIIITKITVSLRKIRGTRLNIPCRDAKKEISKSSVSFAYWTHEGHGNLISQPILFWARVRSMVWRQRLDLSNLRNMIITFYNVNFCFSNLILHFLHDNVLWNFINVVFGLILLYIFFRYETNKWS